MHRTDFGRTGARRSRGCHHHRHCGRTLARIAARFPKSTAPCRPPSQASRDPMTVCPRSWRCLCRRIRRSAGRRRVAPARRARRLAGGLRRRQSRRRCAGHFCEHVRAGPVVAWRCTRHSATVASRRIPAGPPAGSAGPGRAAGAAAADRAIAAAHHAFDARAMYFGHRYRSGFWAIYLLSAIAVLFAVLPLALGWDSSEPCAASLRGGCGRPVRSSSSARSRSSTGWASPRDWQDSGCGPAPRRS